MKDAPPVCASAAEWNTTSPAFQRQIQCYDMIYLTAIVLTTVGSRTMHIYTQTRHGTTQRNNTQRAEHT
jgi:hypothetical protein